MVASEERSGWATPRSSVVEPISGAPVGVGAKGCSSSVPQPSEESARREQSEVRMMCDDVVGFNCFYGASGYGHQGQEV